MELTPYQLDIITAKICPICKSKTRVTTEEEIYSKTYRGRAIICCKNYPNCDTYVGTHEDGTTLGRLADWKGRIAKKEAHEAFDMLWKQKLIDRDTAYEELADFLEIPDEYCHIGMFSVTTCVNAKQWAKMKYYELFDGKGKNSGNTEKKA